jgi:hypothetical protein
MMTVRWVGRKRAIMEEIVIERERERGERGE